MESIPADELAKLDRAAQIVDVREALEVDAVRIPGALNIPMSAFMERFDEVPLDDTVYILCHVGGRSAQVTAYLEQRGYDAVNVEGGIQAWESAGHPVERGA